VAPLVLAAAAAPARVVRRRQHLWRLLARVHEEKAIGVVALGSRAIIAFTEKIDGPSSISALRSPRRKGI
jgi:hypothetical protein